VNEKKNGAHDPLLSPLNTGLRSFPIPRRVERRMSCTLSDIKKARNATHGQLLVACVYLNLALQTYKLFLKSHAIIKKNSNNSIKTARLSQAKQEIIVKKQVKFFLDLCIKMIFRIVPAGKPNLRQAKIINFVVQNIKINTKFFQVKALVV